MSSNKSIKDSQINYLINLFKTKSIENVYIDKNILHITKNGQTEVYELSINEVTDTIAGLMTPKDKIKIDTIEDGAQVNQNAFSAIKFNDTAVIADTASDILNITSGINTEFLINEETESIVIDTKVTTDLTQSGLIPDAKVVGDAINNINSHIFNIDYGNILAFDTSEIVFDSNIDNKSSILGKAILGQMVLG